MAVDISNNSNNDNKICQFAKNGDLKGIQNTIEIDEVDVNFQDEFGRTALSYAAEQDHYNVAEYLVNKGANQKIMDLDGRTPLFYPVIYGHFEIIEFLVGQGQRSESRCTGGRKGVGLGHQGREAYMQVYMYKNKF